MRAGVSTACLFPMEMEKALHQLGQQGITLCECFFNTPTELKAPSVQRLRQAAESYGMTIQSVHPFHSETETMFFFSPYKNRLEDGIEIYQRYFEVAAELQAPFVIFHGDFARNQDLEEEQAFEHIFRLREAAKPFGIELLHENVARCKGGQADYLLRLKQAIPEMGFVLDCKQALRAGHQALDFVEALGSSIRHIHISDSVTNEAGQLQQDCVPPGQGNFDFSPLLQALLKQGADYSAIVELYSNSFHCVEELTKSCDFVQHMINKVEKMQRHS